MVGVAMYGANWPCRLTMSSYETAFAAAVKMDEVKSRKHISFITFYGGVATISDLAIDCAVIAWLGHDGNMYGLRHKFGS